MHPPPSFPGAVPIDKAFLNGNNPLDYLATGL